MKQKILWLLCGCPASGKSTWVANKIKENGGISISRDEIRFNLLTIEDEYFDKEKEVFSTYINTLKESFKTFDFVYADATHINWPSRNKVLRHFSKENIMFGAVVFHTPLGICLQRNAQRTGRAKVPEDVIKNMFHQFSSPINDPFIYDSIIEVNGNE